jgi:tetratricopeptide (TPR) repeat protein/O-antigen ligase
MLLLLPARAAQPSRLSLSIAAVASGAAALLMIVACVFTQSRGPLLGLGAGLFVFFSLLLWIALRRAGASGATRLAGRLRILLLSWVAITLLTAAFLAAFNLSQAPFFERLRTVPYLGRLGTLLEVDSGTGLVRRLIWAGDAHGGGAIGLITSNPLRTLIGWGPESMFVAFNPFFPPSLSNVEARGASPDRSHQAILDELVTRGLIGLSSYLFLLLSFATLCVRLMRRSTSWGWQVFFVAMLTAVVCTFVEGLTGIPIVATLMMFWITLALTVAGGALDGHYQLGLGAAPAAVAEEAPTPERKRQGGPGNRRGAVARGAAAARSQGGQRAARRAGSGPGALLAYAALLLVALWITWTVNVAPVYADMVFQEGQGLSDRAGLDPNQLVQVIDDYLRTVRSDPGEDFYYLNLGRALMSMGDSLRVSGVGLGQPDSAAKVETLLRLDGPEAVAGFVQRSSPLGLMSYAEVVLLKAHALNPLNKDHFANLGRLNSYWYSLSRDPERLKQSLSWYERVAPVAPNDVTLINERAGAVMQLGDYYRAASNGAQAEDQYGQADELLRRSLELDQRYGDTYLRQGDLRLSRGDPAGATDSYLKAIELAPTAVTGAIERIAGGLAGHADQLLRLREAFAALAAKHEQRAADLSAQPAAQPADLNAANAQAALSQSVVGLLTVRAGDLAGALAPYQRATLLQPTSADYSRNYTIVLSDTKRYAESLAEANRMLAALQAAKRTDEAAQVEQLIQIVQQAQQKH